MKKYISILMALVMVSLLVMSSTSVSSATGSVYNVYIEGSGYTGDKKCNGGSDGIYDQKEINEAINYVLTNSGTYNTIHLRPGTYEVDGTILMGGVSAGKIYLEGEGSNTIIKLKADPSGWVVNQAVIQEKSGNQSNIVIRNMKIDGNGPAFTTLDYGDPNDRGHSMYNLIYLLSCSNVELYGLTLTHNFNDGIKLTNCTNVQVYDNLIDEIGHDGLYAFNCSQISAYNNRIYLQTNSGLRTEGTNNVSFHDNVISTNTGSGGGSGIQIAKVGEGSSNIVNDVSIYNNTIFNTEAAGIWVYGSVEFPSTQTYSSSSVKVVITHNLIYNCGKTTNKVQGGISCHGFNADIYYNTIDNCGLANIITQNEYKKTEGYNAPTQSSPYTLNVMNNIITKSTGKGLYDNSTKTVIISNYNDVFDNAGGNYSNVDEGTGDISSDPLFASTNASNPDYHLQSRAGRYSSGSWVYDDNSSPCIDAGDPTWGYSNEPLFNGNRVNMGRYAETNQASKSPCKIKNTVTGEYMHNQYTYNDDNAIVQCSSLGDPGWWSARWTFEDLGGGYYKIISFYSKKYMNTEHYDYYVQCDADGFGWAAQWYMGNDGNGHYYFKNRYRNTYIYKQNQQYHVELSSTLNNSSYWVLETAQ